MSVTLAQIRTFLASYQPSISKGISLRRAAVLLPLFHKNGALHLLFTIRTETVEHHKGQISFPGGAVDEQDTDSAMTALRESEEEISLHRSEVEVLGVLGHYNTPSGYTITPVVGYLRSIPTLTPSSHEVAEIFDAPLEFFLDRTNERVIPVKRNGKWRDVYFYNYGRYEIWGVTAAILRSFLSALVHSEPRS